jgi:hypothetical protein
MSFEHYDLEFTKDGHVHDNQQMAKIMDNMSRLSDMIIIAHGWNNDTDEARKLYDDLFASVTQVLGTGVVGGLEARKFGVVRVFWPSKRFADEELIPGGGAASATRENDDALIRLLDEMKRDPQRLGGKDVNSVRESNVNELKKLVPQLESDANARREYIFRLRSILDPSEAHIDDGSEEFFTLDPEKIFAGLTLPVVAPVAQGSGGGATSMTGGAAGLGDMLSGIKAAARRIANFTTYYEMKQRAGTVGRIGVAPLIRRLRASKGNLRLHLIGHSFGGRLVTTAADGLPANTEAVSLSLLQAAYSHNGLAEKFDGTHNGAFRQLLTEKRISGPILITHTKNDRAVGVAYPLASRISRDQASALGDQNDPFGGMGRNGAQHTPEAEEPGGDLQAVGRPYQFASGKVYNLRADSFVRDHNDVTGHQIAYALLNAAKAI